MNTTDPVAIHCWSSTGARIERASALAVSDGATVGFASVIVRPQLRTAVLTVISADRTPFGRDVSIAMLGQLVDELVSTGTTMLQATVADTDRMSVGVLRAVARERSSRMRARAGTTRPSRHIVIELDLAATGRARRHTV